MLNKRYTQKKRFSRSCARRHVLAAATLAGGGTHLQYTQSSHAWSIVDDEKSRRLGAPPPPEMSLPAVSVRVDEQVDAGRSSSSNKALDRLALLEIYGDLGRLAMQTQKC